MGCKNGFAYVLTFFSLIFDGLGSVLSKATIFKCQSHWENDERPVNLDTNDGEK